MRFLSRFSRSGRWKELANQNPPLRWTISPFMHHHAPTAPSRSGASVALCRLILVLLHLSMVATAQAAQQTLAIPQKISQPYLSAMGSPGLRFKAASANTPLTRRPAAGGPPVAATTPENAEVALANNQAAASTPPFPPSETPVDFVPPEPAGQRPGHAPTSKVKPILPDDTPRPVQSQDFLPLFRFPGNGYSEPDVLLPGSGPMAPTPYTMPQSSATYRQE